MNLLFLFRVFTALVLAFLCANTPAPSAQAQAGDVSATSTVTATSTPTATRPISATVLPTATPTVTPYCYNNISGIVWHDLDGDGQEANEGVEDALVSLFMNDGLLAYQTVSEAGGLYRFRSQILCGQYRLTATWDDESGGYEMEVGEVSGLEWNIEIRHVSHPLRRTYLPLALTRPVCQGSVDVHVYDSEGHPTGAVLLVKRTDGVNWGTSVEAPDGHYKFRLVCGEYRLTATNSTLGLTGWIGLKVDGRAIVRMVFMYPTTSVAANSVCQSDVSGRTFWDRNASGALDFGEEISATVTLFSLGGNVVAEAESGSGGAFDFGQRDCGEYRLQGRNGELHLRGGRSITTTEILEFWDIPMSRETSVSIVGTVFDDTNGNNQQDAGELGVYGLVMAYSYAARHLESAWTSSSGQYSVVLSGLDVQFPEGYRLFFSRSNPWMYVGPILVPTIPLGETRTVNIPVHVPRMVYLPQVVR